MIPDFGGLRQADICEFKASQVYRASSRTVSKTTERNPVVENKNKATMTTKINNTNKKHSLLQRTGVQFSAPTW